MWYLGGLRDRHGLGILVDGDFRECVVEVRRIIDSMMIIKVVVGRLIMSMISTYAPQVCMDEEIKNLF